MKKPGRGGKRSGAGRKPLDPMGEPRKRRTTYATDDEWSVMLEARDQRREEKARAAEYSDE